MANEILKNSDVYEKCDRLVADQPSSHGSNTTIEDIQA